MVGAQAAAHQAGYAMRSREPSSAIWSVVNRTLGDSTPAKAQACADVMPSSVIRRGWSRRTSRKQAAQAR
jgi:hypothetical protein